MRRPRERGKQGFRRDRPLVHTKRRNPSQVIIVAGCMAGEEKVREKIRQSYRHVDAVLDTTSFWRLPEVILGILGGGRKGGRAGRRRRRGIPGPTAAYPKVCRFSAFPLKAGVSVMYGCNNFCTYCIVPYLRRERAGAADIPRRFAVSFPMAVKDIMLLGQNVNSYGKILTSRRGDGAGFRRAWQKSQRWRHSSYAS